MMPTDAERFKFWADRECIDWPGELTAQAYRAWCDLLGYSAHSGAFEKFKEDYANHGLRTHD